jgi:hypothetical protein
MDEYSPSKSKAIQNEVDRWVAAGRKRNIIKKADYVINGRGYFWEFKGMAIVLSALKKKKLPEPIIWVAKIPGSIENTLLFFADTDSEVLSRIGTLEPKSNPRNVLVKMAALRLQRIRKAVESFTNTVGTSRAKRIQITSMFPIDTMRKCRYLIDQRSDFYQVKVLRTFINENADLDDSVIKEAWDFTDVQVIMES